MSWETAFIYPLGLGLSLMFFKRGVDNSPSIDSMIHFLTGFAIANVTLTHLLKMEAAMKQQ